MVIIDAKDCVLGRVATVAAKKAINGEKVEIINADQAIVTGKKSDVLAKYKRRTSMGVPKKGPYQHRKSDRIVRRAIRGMIPYKTARGREAYSRVKCYIGVPKAFEGKDTLKLENADISKLTNLKYVYIHHISKELGAKV